MPCDLAQARAVAEWNAEFGVHLSECQIARMAVVLHRYRKDGSRPRGPSPEQMREISRRIWAARKGSA